MIQQHRLDTYYFVTKIKEHQQNKDAILSAIQEMPDVKLDRSSESIQKTDFILTSDYHRKYLDIFYSMIEPYMVEMSKMLKCEQWVIQNAWFQQYENGGTHGWHTHPNTQFTNVYFLECPESSMITELCDVLQRKKIDLVAIEEGDILTFPAFMLHKSKKLDSLNRKTIISFNSSFWQNNDSDIESLVRGTNYD